MTRFPMHRFLAFLAFLACLLLLGTVATGCSESRNPAREKIAAQAQESSAASASGAATQVAYACPMHPEQTSDQPGSCDVCGMALVAGTGNEQETAAELDESVGSDGSEHAVYACPMHPDQTSDQPGSCDVCGMALVARETARDTAQETTPATE